MACTHISWACQQHWVMNLCLFESLHLCSVNGWARTQTNCSRTSATSREAQSASAFPCRTCKRATQTDSHPRKSIAEGAGALYSDITLSAHALTVTDPKPNSITHMATTLPLAPTVNLHQSPPLHKLQLGLPALLMERGTHIVATLGHHMAPLTPLRNAST